MAAMEFHLVIGKDKLSVEVYVNFLLRVLPNAAIVKEGCDCTDFNLVMGTTEIYNPSIVFTLQGIKGRLKFLHVVGEVEEETVNKFNSFVDAKMSPTTPVISQTSFDYIEEEEEEIEFI